MVRGGSVPVGLAGWGGHLYARSGGVRLPPVARDAYESKGLCDGVRGLQEARDETQRPRCAKTQKRVLRKVESYALDDGRQPWASSGPNKSTVRR